jgi:hypothetical protein
VTARQKRERPLVGALVRQVPLRLLDVSVSGCLFESPASISDGSVGYLDVAIDGRHRGETVRICRSVRIRGRVWPWITGAQFLTLAPPSPASLRRVALALSVQDTERTPRTSAGSQPPRGD